jgi:hypothetical protein
MPAVVITFREPFREAGGGQNCSKRRATALNKAASQAPKSSAEVLESPLKLRRPTPQMKVRDARFRSRRKA